MGEKRVSSKALRDCQRWYQRGGSGDCVDIPRQSIALQPTLQLLRCKSADAAAQALLPTTSRVLIPSHKQRVLSIRPWLSRR